jgi:hypothetical protein
MAERRTFSGCVFLYSSKRCRAGEAPEVLLEIAELHARARYRVIAVTEYRCGHA